MEIKIELKDYTEKKLKEIAELKNISFEDAVGYVLEHETERALRRVKSAKQLADRVTKGDFR